jgi:hypothetical protein
MNNTVSGASFSRVTSDHSCIITRFQLNSPIHLARFYLAFRRIRRDAERISGFLRSAFLVENIHTCYTLSFWENERAILEFSSVHSHIRAANSSFRATYRRDLNRHEIWSAQFRLWAISAHNRNWDGLKFSLAESSETAEQELGDPTKRE